ncbi:MBOAT family O-acyltransferase [Rhodoferax sp.]|uniref:MBOAT family O-acyltransferase n=1 Tax=Rhodoferax sp. TaxID=50421 RepID=UPI002612F26A|nr:MBOAT family O-acyltransferase [Rhodoferax sp.]MDD5478691.1 MBOAT family protein [Rhodoferax sp.]
MAPYDASAFSATSRHRWLVFGVAANLLLLGYFKYLNFFISSVASLDGQVWVLQEVVLPLGISFFTFTQIAFLVDSSRGEAKDFDFLRYLLFVTYFPHLIAGPVLHHRQIMPQFEDPQTYRFSFENLSIGLLIFAIGLFKKVMLADDLANQVTPVFDQATLGVAPKFLLAWTAALAFTFQLYFDFSGYSDMAIGVSRMFGVKLPLNFASPYKSQTISEFWRRWHMTLSQFLRDYLYIPLGGNRHGTFRRLINLALTMLLGGLWHGANWTFVIWGGLHGLFLVLHHAWRGVHNGLKFPATPQPLVWLVKGLSVLLTFMLVVLAWVFFRADSLASAMLIVQGCLGLNGLSISPTQGWFTQSLITLFRWAGLPVGFEGVFELTSAMRDFNASTVGRLLLICALLVWFAPSSQRIAERWSQAKTSWVMALRGLAVAALMLISISHIDRISTFIYYQF